MNHSLFHSTLLALAAGTAAGAAAQDPSSPAPAPAEPPWQRALADAKQQHAPILAFVLPPDVPASPESVRALRELERSVGMLVTKGREPAAPRTDRDLLLRRLQLLRRPERQGLRGPATPSRAQAILALTVPVVCAAEHCGARPGETVVLCGADGRRIGGFAVDLLDRDAFTAAVGPVVLAPDALAARRAAIPPQLAQDLARRAAIVANGECAALLGLPAIDARLRVNVAAVAPAFATFAGDELQLAPELGWLEQQRAPVGTVAHVDQADPCPPCGMAFVPPELVTVLRLIGP